MSPLTVNGSIVGISIWKDKKIVNVNAIEIRIRILTDRILKTDVKTKKAEIRNIGQIKA